MNDFDELLSHGKFDILVTSFLNKRFKDNQELLLRLTSYALTWGDERKLEPLLSKLSAILECDEELIENFYEIALSLSHQTRTKLAKALGLEDHQAQIIPDKNIETGLAELCIKRFKGREKVYAVQYLNGNRGAYRPVHKTLNHELIEKHLCGDDSLGVYTVDSNNLCYFAAFDFDIKRSVIQYSQNIEEHIDELKLLALKLAKSLKQEGFDPLIEFSGYKGYHLWIFFKEGMPAMMVRRFFLQYAENNIKLPAKFSWEFFPRQDKVKREGLGNLIKIPLGRHAVSGKFSYFIDEDGKRISQEKSHLESIERFDRKTFFEKCGQIIEETIAPVQTPNQIPPKLKIRKDHSEELARLMTGCDTLRTLRKKLLNYKVAEGKEEHVLVYILKHLGEAGNLEIHRILSQTFGYDMDRINEKIKSVPPNQMSCPKVRKNIPHIADKSNCNCQFDLPDGAYPSPLVYLGQHPGIKSNQISLLPEISKSPHSNDIQSLINRYLESCAELELLTEKIYDMEKLLRSAYPNNEGFETALGNYQIDLSQRPIIRCVSSSEGE